METTFYLDPSDPSLDHHRPGGVPLLGTAIGIDTMLTAVLKHQSPADCVTIEGISVLDPVVIREGKPQRIVVVFDPSSGIDDRRCFRTRLISPGGETTGIQHFTADFVLYSQDVANLRRRELPFFPNAPMVNCEDVYKVYFHGPAFQVIASAQIVDKKAIAQSTLQNAHARIPSVARLVEFGLQTSGLLELASTGRMMIPNRIDRISLSARSDVNCVNAAYAIAQNGTSMDGHPAIDIEIIDVAGNVVIEIEGYQTLELSFDHDRTASKILRALLTGIETPL